MAHCLNSKTKCLLVLAVSAAIIAFPAPGFPAGWENRSPYAACLSGSLNAMWGSASQDVFAVGEKGLIMRYAGRRWDVMRSPTREDLTCVWGAASNHVFAAGSGGVILFYDGARWEPVNSGTTDTFSDIRALGDRFYAVSREGGVFVHDDQGWRRQYTAPGGLKALWSDGADTLVAAGVQGLTLHLAPGGWTPGASNHFFDLEDIWGFSANDIYAAGAAGVIHFDGQTWAAVLDSPSGVSALWGAGAGNLFAAGMDGTVYHHDGADWTPLTSAVGERLRHLWGTSANDVYAVGDARVFLHYDGSQWKPINKKEGFRLNAIWGGGVDNIVSVGATGAIVRFDGVSWKEMESPTTDDLYALWGASGQDLVAVGDRGAIVRFNGAAWEVMTSPTTDRLNAVWGYSADDIYAVGDAGALLHYDGARWVLTQSGTAHTLKGVWANARKEVFMSAIYLVSPSGDSPDPCFPPPWPVLHGALYRFRQGAPVETLHTRQGGLYHLRQIAPDSVYAAGLPALHYDGVNWSVVGGFDAADIWGVAADHLFGISGSDVRHYDGAAAADMKTGMNLHLSGIWGDPDDGLYVVGEQGLILYHPLNIDWAHPIANAGPDQEVFCGQTVVLDATGSTDPSGGKLSYLWEVVSGNAVVTGNSDSAVATFVAPLDFPGKVHLRLTVENQNGLQTGDDVSVSMHRSRPVANGGGHYAGGLSGDIMTLDGSQSENPVGDELSFYWEQVDGPRVVLSNANTAKATFIAPETTQMILLAFQLRVSNRYAADTTVAYMHIRNGLPVADAGPDQIVREKQTVLLNGSQSWYPDWRSITIVWEQTGGPLVSLTDPAALETTCAAPAVDGEPASMTFRLTLVNEKGVSRDDVVVTVKNAGGGSGSGCFIAALLEP